MKLSVALESLLVALIIGKLKMPNGINIFSMSDRHRRQHTQPLIHKTNIVWIKWYREYDCAHLYIARQVSSKSKMRQ